MPMSTLLQLVARGKQDAFLTGTPQINFFTHVYRRYANFAIESIPIDMDGTPEFGRRISVVVPRKGDLLSALFLEVDLPPLPPGPSPNSVQNYWVNDIGHAMIEYVTVEIGEKEIDKHMGEWLHIWGELTTPVNQRAGYDQMIGHWNNFPPNDVSGQTLYISVPLQFWFCTRLGAALPLIALQAHPVRIIIKLRPFADLVWNESLSTDIIGGATCSSTGIPASVAPSRIQLYGDYVFLDKDQQHRFATQKHAYLIEQLQISPAQSIPARQSAVNVELNFNNSVKEFIWVVQQERMQAAREWFNFSNTLLAGGGEPGVVEADLLGTTIIRLSGQDRFERRNALYFRRTQAYQRHTIIPTSPALIYVYSFALKPEDEQPSGTLNCSQFTDIQLALGMNTSQLAYDRRVTTYAWGYNILRIEGGLGGVMFIA